MVLKVLFLNFPKTEVEKVPSNMSVTEARIDQKDLTVHDFHAIIIDVSEIFDERWWSYRAGYITPATFGKKEELEGFRTRIKEQVETGGLTFCFASSQNYRTFAIGNVAHYIDNYFWCPLDLGLVNELGDTFYPKSEGLGNFSGLLKQLPSNEITWSCYFSKVPKDATVIAANRAGYSVFVEVPLGTGKLVMLPRFQNRSRAAAIIVNEIIPRILHEEEFSFTPPWTAELTSPFEEEVRGTLRKIENTKRLLFTKDKMLKKAVASAFQTLGFQVQILPDGTMADLRLLNVDQAAVVEVKGHENKQATRDDVLQSLGYKSETETGEKGIVVCNHEFSKKPSERSEHAFTPGAIQLAKQTDISLVSSNDIFEVVMKALENKIDELTLRKMREKIMSGSGLVDLP